MAWLVLPRSFVRSRWAAAATAGMVVMGMAAVPAGASPRAHADHGGPGRGGWSTVFQDNFDGPAGSGVDNQWTYDIGAQYTGTGCAPHWGTQEVETETASPANVSLDGQGHLDITALDSGGSWTSGRIETVRDDFQAPPGGEMLVSATIQQPGPANGIGYWPAFWMLGSGYRQTGFGIAGLMDCSAWPTTGEIDVMEDVNAMSDVAGTLHCGFISYSPSFNGGPCNEYTGLSSGLKPCPGCQTGYNTYSVIVDLTDPANGQIRWYLNGTQYYSVSESQVGTQYWNDVVGHGFFLILDLAVGGAFPNAVCNCSSPTSATTSGGSMSVANVTVAVRYGGRGHQHFSGDHR